MRVLEYTVPPECDGRTLRDFARRVLGFSARVFARQKQTPGGILRNGEPCQAPDLLRAGDRVAFTLLEERGEYPVVERELAVLWENEDFLAVDKPPAMPVHPSPGHDRDSLLNAAAYHYQKTGQNCLFRPLYRLDRNTSGIVLLAKHRAAAGAAVEKQYFAVCQGELEGSGTIDLPIGLEEGSRIRRETGHGDRAVTHWRAVLSREGHTLLSLRLETGRTHQIRVHCAAIRHPLAGDDLYGGSLERIARQALHCGRLWVTCPALDTRKELTADFPPDLRAAFPWLPTVEELRKE